MILPFLNKIMRFSHNNLDRNLKTVASAVHYFIVYYAKNGNLIVPKDKSFSAFKDKIEPCVDPFLYPNEKIEEFRIREF
jgi:hypothetical protein